ncbi:hypothetical protein [Xenorhabdus bovienii]|uniref:Uncharacterized protein n=1 Tax=Xenorhabdus bovienii TaxID=40576 RepID=A0A0B6XBK8_XENBV|nr:hypothetical protein [Xenorhabdus bovienii]CDM90556.1 protein of unknown function [Xenorhabdus bovienii]
MAKIASNSLIFIQTPNLGSACILTTGLIVGWLPRYIEQERPLFKRFSLSTEDIGMQNPISNNRTWGVTDSWSVANDFVRN